MQSWQSFLHLSITYGALFLLVLIILSLVKKNTIWLKKQFSVPDFWANAVGYFTFGGLGLQLFVFGAGKMADRVSLFDALLIFILAFGFKEKWFSKSQLSKL